MGNKSKGVKPYRKNLPSKIQNSGEVDVIAVGDKNVGSILNNTIDILIIQVDLGVAAQVKVSDIVQLHWRGQQYEVHFKGQRLGNIPGSYNKTLLPQSEYQGHLIKVAIYGDPILIVQISLTINKL